MHLLLIHQNFPGQFRELAPARLACGHGVSAIGSTPTPPDGDQWAALNYFRYQFEDQDTPSMEQRGHAVALVCRLIEENGLTPDLVLAHSGWGEALQLRSVWSQIPLVVMPELWGSPLVLGYGFDQELSGQQPDPDLFDDHNHCTIRAIEDSDAALVASEGQRLSFPLPLQQQLTVLPEGIDLTGIHSRSASALQLGDISIRKGDPLITLVSRNLEPLRGLRQLLKAWPLISREHPGARLLMIGGLGEGYGHEEPQGNHHLADGMSLLPEELDRSHIHHLEWVNHDDLIAVLSCSACHIALSYPYTLSWSVLEAMACGAPVISNHGSPISHAITADRNGCLVPFNNHQALAKAVLRLLNEPDLRTELGQGGRQTVLRQFNRATSLQRFEALFEKLVSGGP